MKGQDDSTRRQGRQAMFVIIIAFSAWVVLNLIGGQIGLDARYAFLADFAALAALAWALIVLIRIWLKRQSEGN
ncbi:DUF5337 family protein [Rubricella aquisinus]